MNTPAALGKVTCGEGLRPPANQYPLLSCPDGVRHLGIKSSRFIKSLLGDSQLSFYCHIMKDLHGPQLNHSRISELQQLCVGKKVFKTNKQRVGSQGFEIVPGTLMAGGRGSSVCGTDWLGSQTPPPLNPLQLCIYLVYILRICTGFVLKKRSLLPEISWKMLD